MQATRARFVGTGTAFMTAGIIRYPAGAAEFAYKLALNSALTYPPNARTAEACEKISKESGGRLEIKVFPAGQLGGNMDLLSQLRMGAVEMLNPPNVDVST